MKETSFRIHPNTSLIWNKGKNLHILSHGTYIPHNEIKMQQDSPLITWAHQDDSYNDAMETETEEVFS